MSLTVNENEYGLTVSETPTHSLTVSGTSSPLTIASDDLTLTVSDTPTSLLTVTGSTDPSITVQDNNILLTIDQSTGSSGSNPFDQSLNTTDSPTFAAITVSGTVDGRDLSVDGTKLDGIAVQANKYVHPTYTSRSINTSGASVLDEFTSDVAGHVTNITTRTLTLADLGYTGATNADVTPSWVPSTNPNYLTAASTDLDSRYYTETETNGFLNLKANKLSPVFTGVPSAPNLTLTALSTYSGSDVTALMIKSNGVVGKRVLGSAAFSATSAFAPASHTSATNNPHSVTASQVGLGNVTNESKATMFASPTFTGTPTAPTPTLSDDSTKLATTEYVKGQTIAYSSLSGKPTIPSGNQIIDWTQDQGSTEIHAGNYINTDTLTSLALTNGSLVYTAEDGATTSISLAAYLDEDSRAIASGVLNATSGVVTFTRDDSTTFTLNLSALLDDTNLVTSVAGKSGVVTLVKGDVGLGNVTNESKATMFASPTFTGTLTTPNLTVSNLSPYSGSDVTALMINGSNVVGKRALGSAAFSATSDFAAASALGDYYTETEVNQFLNLKANKASPTFTGTITTPNLTVTNLSSYSGSDVTALMINGSNVVGKRALGSAAFSATGDFAAASHASDTSNPHSVTSSQVGLGNVTNESKATMFASPTFTGSPTAPTPSLSDNNTNIATTEYVKGQSYLTASSTAVTSKLPLAGGTLTGNLILDDGSGDSPTLRFQDGSDIKFNVYAGGTSLKITREGNGGADFVITADATDYTDSSLSIGGATVSPTKIGQWNTAYTHTSATNNPHSVTKTQVGLGNVTNESKATMFTSPTFTGTPTAPTPSLSDNNTNIATTEYVKGQTIAYADLTGKPTIPSGNQIIDWTADQGSTDIHVNNLPTIPYSSISGTPAAAQIVDWTVDQGSTDIHVGNISEASVTQHQGELSITESQISDLGTYLTASSTDLDSRYYTETETNQFLNLKANLAGPTFTGSPTAPTPSLSDNNTNIATTEYVKGQSYLTASSTEVTSKAPIANPSFTGDVDVAGDLNLTGGQLEMRGDVALDHDGNSLYLKAPSSIFFYTGGNNNRGNINSVGNVTFTGSLTVSGGNSTNWNTAYGWGNHASAGYLTAASTDLDSRYYTETETNQFLNLKANLAGPTFTGSPKAPTPSLSDNNTNIATTEYVKGQNYLISTSAAVTSKLPLAGGTMTGSIDMGTNDITNAGEIEANEFIGNLRGAVSFTAKAGEALTKGDVVYISGISGNQTVVAKAEADDASKMPAFGVASETVTINANVTIINFGRVNNLDTSGFSEGDELFVSNTAGVLSSTTPTGESSALQKMAKVTRSHASAGSITVMGAGRSNAVPNLNEGRLFVGNSSNKAVADDTAYVDIANSRVGIGTTSPSNVLHVKSTTLNNGAAAKIENTRDGGSDHGLQVTANGSAGSFATRIQQQGAGDILQVLDGSTEVFTILDGGNVGIGTGSPAHKLDVAGAIRANGNIVTTSASQIMASRKFSALNTSGVMLTDSGASNGLSIANGGNATFSHNLTVSGDLTVNGTTTTINSTTVQVDDKNIELGTVATPTDATADGGGITLKGATDKTINWINSTDSWTSSERISITPAGSASLPALTFGGDNDTGIYRFVSGSDAYIGFSTAGSQRGYFGPAGITSSANVYSASGGEFRNYGGTWRGTTGQTGNGFQFINSVDGTAMTLSSTGAMVVTSSVSVPNLTLTNLSTYSGSDVTALMIAGGNVVGKRALGSNAFNSTAFITASSTDTLTNKTWNGNVIASAYLDADTAHLSGTQTFTGAKTFGNITSSGGYKANIAESSDADNITSNNIKYGYLANAASNKPVSGNSQYASVGNITLTHYDAASVDDFYIRAKAYNGNTSWAKIFTDQNSAFAPLASPALTGSPTAPTPSLSDNNTNIATTEYVKGQNYLISTSAAVTSKLPLAGGTITGNINLNDDVKIRFGAVQDFELYHASSGDSYIVNKTGILDIRNTVHGGDIKLQVENTSGTLEEYLRIDGGLGYTVSSKAIRIADGKALFLGDGEDLGIYHFASNNYIQNNLGDLIIQNDANDKDIIFKSDNGSGGVTEYFRLDGSSTGLTVSAPQGMVFFDNIKAKFGNNDDLQIYHNGSNSYVVNNTGDLEIINNTDDGDIKLISDDGSGGTATYFQLDGSQAQLKVHKDMVFHDSVRARFGTGTDFDIYHDGSNGYVVNNTGDLKIFNHTDDGKIDFTSDNGTGGTATYVSIDGSAVQTRFYKNTRHSDGVIALFGSSNDLQIFHDGSNSYIQDTGTGNFNLQSNSLRLLGADASAMLVAHQGGAVNLYHNGSAKLETTSSGIYVAGNIQLLDSSSTSFGRITFGHGNDLQIYHNGTESNITNATGNFYISQTANDADIIFECDNGSGGLTPYLTLDGSLSQMWADKDLQFSDNIKAKFGAGSDLQIYHNGSNSYVVNNTGDLEIINNTDDGDIIFKSDDGSGGVTPYLRLDGSHTQMLATKNLHFDDNVKALFGGYASPDLQIYHDGSHSFIKDTGTGDLKISSNTVRIESDGAESMIIASANGSVNLYYNNVNKLQTTSSGISVAGSVGVTNIVTNRIVKFNGSILDDSVMVDDGTNVGIGVTNPARKLHVSTGNTDVAARFENTTSNGNVIEVKTSGDNRTLNIQTDHIYSNGALHLGSDSYHTYIRGSKVGIRTTSPSYHLDVSGGIRAGGKVTYEKSAASLTTTGYAVAGLTSSPNGNGSSAGFTFTCFGHTGDYQRIVYSCYNTTGTWNTQKVIDEGTNDFDVTASANGSTITFTFKSRSGTKSYTPRVSVEAFGSSINNTYA